MPDRDAIAGDGIVVEERPGETSGAWLRREREARGIALEEVSAKTRIKLEFLRDLECGELDRLPARVFVGGFARAMAQAIGADADEASRRLGADYHARSHMAEIPAGMLAESAADRRRRFGVVLVVVVILIAATLTLSLLLRRAHPSEGGLSQRTPAMLVGDRTPPA